jgi:hypothetical protein
MRAISLQERRILWTGLTLTGLLLAGPRHAWSQG